MLEATPNEEKEEPHLESEKRSQEEFSDFQWSQLYTSQNKRTNFDDIDFNYENLYCATTNLQDHLRWQLDLTPMSDIDRVIATAIIDAIDDDGFLTQTMLELHTSLDSEAHPLDLEEIEVVRHRVQHFDPVGCASSNLAETLLVQLEQLPDTSSDLDLAKRIVRDDIELLGHHNYRQLMKSYQVNEAQLDRVLQIIQRLNPKPGGLIQQSNTEYIIPDIIVKKSMVNGRYL